ncbi:MAG TPA: ADP-ribosylglycohydrolase family protein [Pirellulales bacterium]|jgi:ADP-ribosyl-[dinitrogen reductase] hydrolase|nr:ADP-ribosylglycohydrolase family protein [Pirellulales bacterium]
MSPSDRILGCILGGALGDAVGGPYENRPLPIRINPDAALRLSDDTQLTLLTCDALVHTGRPDPQHIAAAFAASFQQRQLNGLGASTFKALQELAAGGHWALVGSKGEFAAGNGPATRIAPLAFLLDASNTTDRQTIRDVCRITHHNDEAYCGALAIVVAIQLAFRGRWRGGEGLIREVSLHLPDSAVRDRLTAMAADSADAPFDDIARRFGTSGHVVESVPLAMIAAERLGEFGFRAVIEEIIAVGGDTDSTASIAGQICGTCGAHQGLPQDWLDRLPDVQDIRRTADRFAKYVETSVNR